MVADADPPARRRVRHSRAGRAGAQPDARTRRSRAKARSSSSSTTAGRRRRAGRYAQRMIDRLIAEAEGAEPPGRARANRASATRGVEPQNRAARRRAHHRRRASTPSRSHPIAQRPSSALETALRRRCQAAAQHRLAARRHRPRRRRCRPFASGLQQRLLRRGSFAVIDETKGEEALGLARATRRKGQARSRRDVGVGRAARRRPCTPSRRAASGSAKRPSDLTPGETRVSVAFDLPLELRNQVARIEIPGERSAGAVSLIDAATQWHRVGSDLGREPRTGAAAAGAALLHPEGAGRRTRSCRSTKDANLAAGPRQPPEAERLGADAGRHRHAHRGSAKADRRLRQDAAACWCASPARASRKAATICCPCRCAPAGARLAARCRGRRRRSSRAFDETSPFAGLAIPADVTINRQVLADPGQALARRRDLGPARRRHAARHGAAARRRPARALPHHGQLRLVEPADLGRCSSICCAGSRPWARIGAARRRRTRARRPMPRRTASSDGADVLPPLKTLDGFGRAEAAAADGGTDQGVAKPTPCASSFEHPPGYYGATRIPRAINVLTPKSTLMPIPDCRQAFERLTYDNAASVPLKSWMLALALALLFADILAVLVLQAGGLGACSGAAAGAPAGRQLCSRSHPRPGVSPTRPRRTGLDSTAPRTGAGRRTPDAHGSDAEMTAVRSDEQGDVRLRAERRPETDETSRQGLTGLGKVLDDAHRRRSGRAAGRRHRQGRDRVLPDPLLARARQRRSLLPMP